MRKVVEKIDTILNFGVQEYPLIIGLSLLHSFSQKIQIIEVSKAVIYYQIENDSNDPNKLINFTIDNMKKDERVLIHFNCWVLILNVKHNFKCESSINYVALGTKLYWGTIKFLKFAKFAVNLVVFFEFNHFLPFSASHEHQASSNELIFSLILFKNML